MSQELLEPAVLARIKGLALRARRVVDGTLQGIHTSPHHGSSIEFSEHKEYTPGDELRHIDWKAYARLDKHYVKRFQQESNLRAFFVLDTSASMGYAADGRLSKLEYASILAVSLSYLLIQQQDAVGVLTFADGVRATLPPRARSTHLSQMCALLEGTEPQGGTSLAKSLAAVVEVARKRGMVFVMSDFFGDVQAAFGPLRQLMGRGHQVTVFQVLDGDELDFPFDEMTLFRGMESEERLLAEPRLIRDAYLRRLRAHNEAVRTACLQSRIDHLLVDTREDPGRLLAEFLTTRELQGRTARER